MWTIRRTVRTLVETKIGTLIVYDTGGKVRQVRYGPWHSPWCQYITYCMQRAGLNQTTLGQRIDMPQPNVQAYITGKIRPPLESLDKFARALQLSREEKVHMTKLAYQPWTPPEVWAWYHTALDRVAELERTVSELRQQVLTLSKTPSVAPAPHPNLEES